MNNVFQTILFSTRSNDGVVEEHSSLNNALETFINEDGYRLDFHFPDGRVLYIYRGDYGDDIESPYSDHPTFSLYDIAKSKVMFYDPNKVLTTTDNVVHVNFNQ